MLYRQTSNIEKEHNTPAERHARRITVIILEVSMLITFYIFGEPISLLTVM
jgi:hypothetical protein